MRKELGFLVVMMLIVSWTAAKPLGAHEDGDDDDDYGRIIGSVVITPDQAVAEAQKVVPGKVVLRVKLDDEHGAWVYEVYFTDGTEVKVDAATGVVVEVKRSHDHHGVPTGPVTITPDQAVAEAQKVVPGKVVLRVKLDDEHGAWVYEVYFTDGTEVKVDAVTGSVLYVESPRSGSGSQNPKRGGGKKGGNSSPRSRRTNGGRSKRR